jgi:hypothetical protein
MGGASLAVTPVTLTQKCCENVIKNVKQPLLKNSININIDLDDDDKKRRKQKERNENKKKQKKQQIMMVFLMLTK